MTHNHPKIDKHEDDQLSINSVNGVKKCGSVPSGPLQ